MIRNPPYLIPIAIISILTALILIKCEERKLPLAHNGDIGTYPITESKTTNWAAAIGAISNLHISEVTHTDENGNVIGKYSLKPDGTMDHGCLYGQKPSSKNKSNWSLGAKVHGTTELKEPVKVYKDTNGFVTNVIRKEMRKLWSKEEVNHPNCGNMKNDYEYPVADLSCTDARTGERRVAYFNLNSAKRFIDTDNPNIKWLGQIFNGYECGLHPDGFMVWREAK